MTVNEYRKNWRQTWLTSLLCLSDIILQQRWLDPRIRNPAWTYVEFMCVYFDDLRTGDGYADLISEGLLSFDEFQVIQNFHEALSAYEPPKGDYDHQAILSDEKWQKIVAQGKTAMTSLREIISDLTEKNLFIMENYAPALTDGDYTWPEKPDGQH